MSHREKLFELAKLSQQYAYAPYSNFYVGAALLSENQRYYSGCNVENAAYPLCQCAEATAIGNLISQGCQQIHEVVIVGSGPQLISPCGACRQRIAEFATTNCPIHLADRERGIEQSFTLEELLPFSFDLK